MCRSDMTHIEESLMALADAAMWQASLQSGNDKDIALRRAIREVLAERDALRVQLSGCQQQLRDACADAEKAEAERDEARLQQKAWTDKWDHAISRAEKAEAECERLRNDLSVHKRLLDDKIADCISWINENERLRKDAERYRHIRQFEITAYWKDGDCAYSENDPAELDAAIDAALKNQP